MVALQERCVQAEQQASAQVAREASSAVQETTSLRQQLRQVEVQSRLKDQATHDLETKVQSLEENQRGLELMLREKQEACLESAKSLKHQKHKTHKLADKVPEKHCLIYMPYTVVLMHLHAAVYVTYIQYIYIYAFACSILH